MSFVLPLPNEVAGFLARPPPETLVVRGPAGSGKTTFALALLSSFTGKRLFASTRVSPQKLARNYPWLATGEGEGIIVFDASDRGAALRNSAKVLQGLEAIASGAPVDPASFAEWMPPAFSEAAMSAVRGVPTMLVFDSWDATIEGFLDAPTPPGARPYDRLAIERLILSQFATGPYHVVLVLERNEATPLDYFVDGVVSLENRLVDEREERWLHLQKLRGVRLDLASYPFTLEGARFRCITPMVAGGHPRLNPPDPDPSPTPGTLWPGSVDFAEQFGRLPVGFVALFEREIDVSDEAINIVLAPFISEVLLKGGRVFHVLGSRTEPKSIWEACRSLIPHDKFQQQVRILTPATGAAAGDPDLKGVVLPLPRKSDSSVEPRVPEAVRFLSEGAKTGAPNLAIIWASGLASLGAVTGAPYRPETLPLIMLDYAVGTNLCGIFIGVLGDPLIDSVRAIAPRRLCFSSRSGRVFVYGKSPMTPKFVLIEGEEKTPYRLLRVV
jgi:KaiC/GvpD/RAD55 family RecA-like ATPase